MKILKKGNYFKAYATVEKEGGTQFNVGDSMGSISIKTGKFTGATASLVELYNHLEKHKETTKVSI